MTKKAIQLTRLAATFSIMLLGMSINADAALFEVRLNAIASNGLGSCHATFNLNPAQAYTVNNVNIRVGGSTQHRRPRPLAASEPHEHEHAIDHVRVQCHDGDTQVV